MSVESNSVPAGRLSRMMLDNRIGLSLLLFFIGALISVSVYESVQPLLVTIVMFCCAFLALRLTGIVSHDEWQAFVLIFAVGWFWMAIAAAYSIVFDDFFQNYRDPINFFDDVMAGNVPSLTDWALLSLVENAGALILWGFVYDVFLAIGFKGGPYVGIAFNNLMVGLTAIVGVKIVKCIYGNDPVRIRRFVLLYAWCGLFWTFAATHLRDAATLLAISLLILTWVLYLTRPSVSRLLWVGASSTVGFLTLGLLRVEFAFVPLALIWAAIMAFVFSTGGGKVRRRILVVSLILALPVGVYLYTLLQGGLLEALITGQETYNALTEGEQGSDSSLGNALIVSQPAPIRLILGAAYLFVYPIPVWTGFQLQSVYHLLKSTQALYMYAFTPLLGLAVWRLWRNPSLRTPPVMYLFFVALIFLFGIAYTSLENRHLGSFFVAFLALALLPDLSCEPDKAAYRKALFGFIGVIALGHLAWSVLKVL